MIKSKSWITANFVLGHLVTHLVLSYPEFVVTHTGVDWHFLISVTCRMA